MISVFILLPPQPPALGGARPPLLARWRDEMDRPENWHAIGGGNPAIVTTPAVGLLTLALNRVPNGWPYEYQWSGVVREGEVSFGSDTVLLARVSDVRGYAHLDLNLLDDHGQPGQSFRSSTVLASGLCRVDFGARVFPARFRFRLRLIVGGPNAGCSAAYDWVRFLHQADADRLAANPDLAVVDEKP